MNMNHVTPTHEESFRKKWENYIPQELHQTFNLMLDVVINEARDGMKSPDVQHTKNNTTMTKEQLMQKWGDLSIPLKNDIDAVIATEIEKAKEQFLDKYFGKSKIIPQPELNPIAEAYERGEKIRRKDWQTNCWIKKHSRVHSIDERDEVYKNYSIDFDFDDNPQDWELYTEPAEQPAKPFDKERFERMFRAVVASGVSNNEFITTEEILEELDAYYATKEGGNNG